MFNERLTLNRHAVRLGKPMIECAMYELQAQITTIIPGQSACLACMVRASRRPGSGSSPSSARWPE